MTWGNAIIRKRHRIWRCAMRVRWRRSGHKCATLALQNALGDWGRTHIVRCWVRSSRRTGQNDYHLRPSPSVPVEILLSLSTEVWTALFAFFLHTFGGAWLFTLVRGGPPFWMLLPSAGGPIRFLAASLAATHPRLGPSPTLLYTGETAFQYAFMLPTATAVATSCQLAGIGGAALFSPIFLLIFPLLGPEYPLASPAAAIASALLTEVFGFSSGLSGFAARQLVDWSVALQFASLAVPSALAGALVAGSVASDPTMLRGVYAGLMLGLSAYLVASPKKELAAVAEECAVGISDRVAPRSTKRDAQGREYTYFTPPRGSATSSAVTVGGGFLTGLLGVGIGEVILPQLARECCMPAPVAAGTSVAAVVITALTAATVQFAALAAATGGDLASVVPWDLVQWTVPGVLIGGQLAPLVASRRLLSDATVERFAAGLFAIVGTAFAIKALASILRV